MSALTRLPAIVIVLALAATPGTAGAVWKNVHKQGFEGFFPTGTGWTVADHNGTVGGDYFWDDTPGGYNSTWAAHPADSSTYQNNMNTWMMYGPFSLATASDAKLSFVYWLDTEEFYDYFTYGYACDGLNEWNEVTVSGNSGGWKNASMSLASCVGSTEVRVRWRFVSDGTVTKPGVWVDSIKIKKRV